MRYNHPTFRDFEIWPHLISNYSLSSGRTGSLEFFDLVNLTAVRMPYRVSMSVVECMDINPYSV